MTEMTRQLDSSRLINATSHVHERFSKIGRLRYEVDFHNEVNGFITWDRKVIKVDPKKMRAINMQFRSLEAE